MKTDTTKATAESAEGTLFLGHYWLHPLEAGVQTRIRGFIEELLEAELDAALGRDRYDRPRVAESGRPVMRTGHRHGHRERQLMGTFGPVTGPCPSSPPGNIGQQDGRVEECDHSGLPAAHETGRRADRWRLSCRDQHAPGAPGARCFVRRRRGEGHRQPSLAQGEGRLRCLEGLADHPSDSTWHNRVRFTRQEGHVDFASRGAGCPGGRPKGAAGGREHGWR
jgi:hypothetical protein